VAEHRNEKENGGRSSLLTPEPMLQNIKGQSAKIAQNQKNNLNRHAPDKRTGQELYDVIFSEARRRGKELDTWKKRVQKSQQNSRKNVMLVL